MVLELARSTITYHEQARALRKARRESWLQQKVPHTYNTLRGISGYEEILPKFQGKSVLEVIDEKVKTEGEASVLDVGCGGAIFLNEVGRIYSDVSLAGISSFDYRLTLPPYITPGPVPIDYRIGDSHKLREVFKGHQFDVITSVYSQMYLADPLSVLKQCYGLLKPGGVAFVHEPGFSLNYDQAVALKVYWQRRGIVVSFSELVYKLHPKEPVFVDIAIQKADTTPNIPLPFRYKDPSSALNERYTFTLAA